jgi:hypothetical protein
MSFEIKPVNTQYWYMRIDKLKREYENYVCWFNTQKQTQAGLRGLVEGKRFNEWHSVQCDKDGNYNAKDLHPDDWGLFCLNTAEPTKLIKAATKAKVRNDAFIKEAQKHVDGNPLKPLLDPEYLARAQMTKKLRKQLENNLDGLTYNKEIASDILFKLKQSADENGQDFTQLAREHLGEPAEDIGPRPIGGWKKRIADHHRKALVAFLIALVAYLILRVPT